MTELHPQHGPPLEVLVVDDNDTDVDLTLAALQELGSRMHVSSVADGEAALMFLERRGTHVGAPRPNLVLLDQNLPKKDGFQVLAEMKADPQLRQIPVVMLSGSALPSDISRAYDGQVAAYIVKPTSMDGYFSAIRAIQELWLERASLPSREPLV